MLILYMYKDDTAIILKDNQALKILHEAIIPSLRDGEWELILDKVTVHQSMCSIWFLKIFII